MIVVCVIFIVLGSFIIAAGGTRTWWVGLTIAVIGVIGLCGAMPP